MMTDILYPLAIVAASGLAWDAFRRWLIERAATRVTDVSLSVLTARIEQQELVTKKLAEDWLTKFRQLEADWKQLKSHADSQFVGALEQLPKSRGFGR